MREKIIDVMASVFAVDAGTLPADITFGRYEKWDSLKHMTLVMALEDEFGVTFDDEEATEMLSIDLIAEILSEKLGS